MVRVTTFLEFVAIEKSPLVLVVVVVVTVVNGVCPVNEEMKLPVLVRDGSTTGDPERERERERVGE